jgi:hypothetical protein
MRDDASNDTDSNASIVFVVIIVAIGVDCR